MTHSWPGGLSLVYITYFLCLKDVCYMNSTTPTTTPVTSTKASGSIGASYQTQVNNYINLINAYARFSDLLVYNNDLVDFLPVANLSQSLTLFVGLSLQAINDFDEVAGYIELAGTLMMSWTDEVPSINGVVFDRSVSESFMVRYDKIWTPKLVLTNAIKSVKAVGDSAYMCRFIMTNNTVEWAPRVILGGACTPDITYFPFDRQICSVTFTAWGYYSSEILLETTQTQWDQSTFDGSGEWSVVSTKTETYVTDSKSYVQFTITIERKPLYFAFNIVLPVLMLALLNGLVFLLPVESGERIGYSITCFLSFVVLLNMIMNLLPRSSSPMSYLCYYLVVMMAFSGLVTAVAVLLMRVVHKPSKTKVPGWLVSFLLIVTCNCANIRSKAVSPDEESTPVDIKDSKLPEEKSVMSGAKSRTSSRRDVKKDLNKIHTNTYVYPQKKQTKEKNEKKEGSMHVDNDADKVEWSDVARILDLFFFVVFLASQLFFTVVFLVPLGTRA